MSTVRSLIDRVRVKALLRNPANQDLDDLECVAYLNEAHRELYRAASLHAPEILAQEESGTVTPLSPAITLTRNPVSILDCRIDGDPALQVSVWGKSIPTAPGTPCLWMFSGLRALRVYPSPDKDYPYVICYVPESLPLVVEGDSPWPNDFEDLLVQFALVSWGVRNGMDSSVEEQNRGQWTRQVLDLVAGFRAPSVVRGYWDEGRG